MIITDMPSAGGDQVRIQPFPAAKISFINAIANICEARAADVPAR